MSYALVKNGEVVTYPYSFSKLRTDNPNVSFPRNPSDEKLAEYDVLRIELTPRPENTATQNVVEGTPIFTEGRWVQVWEMVDASPEEIALRQERSAAATRLLDIKADAFVDAFLKMSPVQMTARVDTDVTDLASAKTMLKKFGLILLLLARQEHEN